MSFGPESILNEKYIYLKTIVTVGFGSDAVIPVGTDLTVEEITQFEGASDVATVYEHYADKVGEALDLDTAIFEYARFFDISLVKDGEKIQPAEGSSVNVKIELADTSSDSLKVLHFEGEAVHSDTDGIEEQTVFDSISAGRDGELICVRHSDFRNKRFLCLCDRGRTGTYAFEGVE